MIQWYKKVVIENYANFNGRARRSEYWYFTLANLILLTIGVILDNVLGINFGRIPYGPISIFYYLAILIPGLAVIVRRLHDVGKSGWYFFISFIPFIGGIWLLVLFLTDSQAGDNQYGPNPKTADEVGQIGKE